MNKNTSNITIRLDSVNPALITVLLLILLYLFIAPNVFAEILITDLLGCSNYRATTGPYYRTLPEMLKTEIIDISSSGSVIGKTPVYTATYPKEIIDYWTHYGSFSMRLADEGNETLTMYNYPAKYFIYDVELEFTFVHTDKKPPYTKTTKHIIYDGQIRVDWLFFHLPSYTGYEMIYSVMEFNNWEIREGSVCVEGSDCTSWWNPPQPYDSNLCQLPDGTVLFHISPVIVDNIYEDLKANFYFPLNSNIIAQPAGIIEGQLKNAQPADITDDIREAVVELYRQDSYIRSKRADETFAEYNEYIKTVGKTSVDRRIISPDDNGKFKFTGLPIFGETRSSNTQHPIDYTIMVSNAETIETDINQDPVDPNIKVTTYFANKNTYNLRPFPPDFFDSSKIVNIALTPADAVAAKQALIDQLSLASVGNFLPIENGILQPWLNTMSLTPEHLEAVKRAKWSELIIRDGTLYADTTLDLMLSGLGTLLGDLFDEFTDFTRSDIKDRKAELEKISDNKNVSNPFFNNDKYPFDAERYIKNLVLDKIIEQGEEASKFLTIFKYVKTLTITAAIEMGVPEDDAKTLGDLLQQTLSAMANYLQSRTAKGTLKSALKYLVEQSVNYAKPFLYDDASLPSYTTRIAPILQTSVEKLMNWNQVDDVLYKKDRDITVGTIKELAFQAKSTIDTATTFQESAGALDIFEGIIGLAAESGDKRLKILEIVTKVTKYILNSWSIIDPYLFVFETNKKLVEKGVYEAYGLSAPLSTPVQPITETPSTPVTERSALSIPASVTDDRIYEMIPPAADNLKASINSILNALNTDDIENAMISTSDDTVGNYIDYLDTWNRAVSLYLLQISSFDSLGTSGTAVMKPVSGIILNELGLKALHLNLVDALRDLYVNVLTNEYSGVQDPAYILARDSILWDIGDVLRRINFFLTELAELNSDIGELSLLPVISGRFSELSSDLTGKDVITGSPETFVIKVDINNISSTALNNISAKISVDSPLNSVTLISAPEMAIGSLAAYDGVDGGADSMVAEWSIQYNGDFTPEQIIINVGIEENGGDPVSFVANSPQKILHIDSDLLDKDSDLMTDNWEITNGLNPLVDDSEDDKDGDGLSNIAEFNLGTHPDNPDSDADGLSDWVELNGSNDLYITDPLNTDSDGDTIPDGDDQQPLDGSTDQPMAIRAEPSVAVDQSSIVLTPENNIITINVSNSDAGTLTWTALADNPTAINISPDLPSFRNGDGKLLVTLPPSYNSETQPSINTLIRVIDMGGAIHDSQTINVHLGTIVAADINGDGNVDLIDAILALQISSGISGSHGIYNQADVNDDSRIGLGEGVYILQKISGLRQ